MFPMETEDNILTYVPELFYRNLDPTKCTRWHVELNSDCRLVLNFFLRGLEEAMPTSQS